MNAANPFLPDVAAVRQVVMETLGRANRVGRPGAPSSTRDVAVLVDLGDALLHSLDDLVSGTALRAARAAAWEEAWAEASRRHHSLRAVPVVNPYTSRAVRP